MNYILQHNAFMELAYEDVELKATYRMVYMALFHINNSVKWIPRFVAERLDVMQLAGISDKKTYYSALSYLSDKGYIIYEKSKNQMRPSVFTLIPLYQKTEQHNDHDKIKKSDAPLGIYINTAVPKNGTA